MVEVWLFVLLAATPMVAYMLLILAGQGYGEAIGGSVLITMALAGPSVIAAVLLGPFMGALVPPGYFAWRWSRA